MKRKTLYEVLAALDAVFSPGSTRFSDYVKETSDDNLFLRTAFCKKAVFLKDRKIPENTTHILVACQDEINEDLLCCAWTDDPFEHLKTLTKLQLCFVHADAVAEEMDWNGRMGYPVCYIVDCLDFSVRKKDCRESDRFI